MVQEILPPLATGVEGSVWRHLRDDWNNFSRPGASRPNGVHIPWCGSPINQDGKERTGPVKAAAFNVRPRRYKQGQISWCAVELSIMFSIIAMYVLPGPYHTALRSP